MTENTILVLRQGVPGIPVTDYADAIRDRLPNYDVEVALSRREELENIKDAWIATDKTIDKELIDQAENLRLFAGLLAGYDHLPLDHLAESGVAVTNASGVHGTSIAEQVIGSILVFARRLHEGWRRQQNHEWRHFQTGELQGSTVTVVGMGAVGQAIVERLEGFGVDTVGVRYTPKKGGPTNKMIGFESPKFEPVLAKSDYVVLACPLTETTRNLIGADELATMPVDAVLINVARGGVVETDALVAALQKGEGIRGAALDVIDPEPLPPDHDLWNLENVLITPHMAGQTPKHYQRRADILARNIHTVEETRQFIDLENQIQKPK